MKRIFLAVLFASIVPFVSFAQWGDPDEKKQLNKLGITVNYGIDKS